MLEVDLKHYMVSNLQHSVSVGPQLISKVSSYVTYSILNKITSDTNHDSVSKQKNT